ncbi:RAB11-binding protein RELCH-like isoform X2 [Plodia interpunctella]|uniref:RAB11-binding protein RELCH-like isoform X2 n=1 Tax=Plodia interpunctella TaxID=58824 RepID=UPI0023675063|nr:RAB11-binding protein RELCH-like isoform X2 [Plodia interpunctella]
MNPYREVEENSFTAPPHLNYEDIATKLLKDHYFLTALELHTELVESGRELPQLREFFSNPGNFEQHVSRASDFNSMHRTPSQATLDSLDTARYSEDGGGDRGGSGGDVAVLEFELRKARETINALRANLTQFADGDSALDKTTKDKYNQRSLKPHEKRALNFLINEYLLIEDYKLTSITFSDENPDQDFEDWDDVGLNTPRPAGLVSLFWGNSASLNVTKVDASTEMGKEFMDSECQTDLDEGNVCVSCQTSMDCDADWNHEKLYDAAIVSLNSLTSPSMDSKDVELSIPEEKLLSVQMRTEASEQRPLTCTATENHYGSGNSTHSATPEQFEIIDSEKNSVTIRKSGSNTSSFSPPAGSVRDSPRRGSVATLDDTLSINDAEWTRVHYEYNPADTTNKEMWIDSCLPHSLKVSILNWCCESLNLNQPLANELLAELVNSDKPMTLPSLLTLLADTLPRLMPHTLVSRRAEAAALCAAGAALLPHSEPRRARLLHTLLTLVKKPEPADARAICEATCLVVKWGGSGEVLSSIAELLSSRSPERRVLASQICVAIAPYVPIELCTSLLLSLVLLMCESNEVEIRSLGLKAACLICPVADHKYDQLENLMFNFLKDPAEKNVKDAVNIFVPVLARSSLIAGKLSSDLCRRVMTNLAKSTTEEDWKQTVLYLEVLRMLVLAKLAYVVNVQIVKDTKSDCDMMIHLQEVPLEGQESFLELQCYVDGVSAKSLVVAMNSLIKEKPEVRWSQLTWFIQLVKQILEVTTNSKTLNRPTVYEHLISLFSSYVENFGAYFTRHILKPIFTEIIGDLEQKMEKLHAINVDSTIGVGVYLVALLPAIENKAKNGEFLQKWIMYSSLRGLPVKIFSVPLKWVTLHRPDSIDGYLQHLRDLSASSCSSSRGSEIRSYIAQLITELLSVADLHEGSIEKQLIPAVVSLLHTDQVSVREVAITTWGSVARTCVVRNLDCAALCWPPMEELLSSSLSSKEAGRAAEVISNLILPTPDSNPVSERAVSLLCQLCHRGVAPACVPALAAALQRAALLAPPHPALAPALRKLEEAVQSPPLSQFKPTIELLIHSSAELSPEPARASLQQEVGRRVTQMFHTSKTNINLPNIFKKKT